MIAFANKFSAEGSDGIRCNTLLVRRMKSAWSSFMVLSLRCRTGFCTPSYLFKIADYGSFSRNLETCAFIATQLRTEPIEDRQKSIFGLTRVLSVLLDPFVVAS